MNVISGAASLGRFQSPKRERWGRAVLTLVVFLPLVAYACSLWIVEPLPLPYFVPLLLIVAPLIIKVPRGQAAAGLFRLKIEVFLVFTMLVLCLLSLVNSDEPFRSLRLILPCAIPLLILPHLIVVDYLSGGRLDFVQRLLILSGVLFAVLPFYLSYALPPLKSVLFGTYRFEGFFEISIQLAIVLSVLIPLIVLEFALARSRLRQLLWGMLLLLCAYTLFRSGTKTAMTLGFLGGLAVFVTLRLREQGPARSAAMFAGFLLGGVLLWIYGLDIAEALEPEIGRRLRDIVEKGASSYQSVVTRQKLWQVALEEGRSHWLIGSGAGESILGYSHAHNLVLEYFKSIGFFGAASIVLLSLTVIVRCAGKGITLLARGGGVGEKRIFGCYMAASVYILCNQMSDCFGPSTVGIFWVVYLTGVLADGRIPGPSRRGPLLPG